MKCFFGHKWTLEKKTWHLITGDEIVGERRSSYSSLFRICKRCKRVEQWRGLYNGYLSNGHWEKDTRGLYDIDEVKLERVNG